MAIQALDDRHPLVVDVDGTLVKSDLLHEALLHVIAHRPSYLFRLVPHLAQGKAAFKARLAECADPTIASVPLREEVVTLIREAQAAGRPVVLASASDHRYVEALAERIGGIDRIFASDGNHNLAGRRKAEALEAAFGRGGFDYIGDRPVDFPVWRSARNVLAVAASDRFAAKVNRAFPDATIVARQTVRPRSYLKVLRVHQWTKNLLLFVPAVAAHKFNQDALAASALAFMCFCFAASSAYIINDLLDLPNDRHHHRKRNRPTASGDLPITHALIESAMLALVAILGALALPPRFLLVLGTYFGATLLYSLVLKRKVLIDVIALGGLYTLRVFAGLAAVTVTASPWLLMFCLCQFLSLAVIKRCSELVFWRDAGQEAVTGRGYKTRDLAVLMPIAAAAGYGAVLVVTLYLSSPEVVALYRHPARLWLVCPLLLYWISRVLILANRGELHDDPVIFASRDRVSWLTGFLTAVIVAVSI